MSSYKDVIAKARQPEDQQTGIPESQNIEAAVKDEEVNLSIKVSKRRRQHWAAEAKRQGTTLTAIVSEALSTKFGEQQV